MTHAVAAILKGDLALAWDYNPLSLTVLPVLLIYGVYRISGYVRSGRDSFHVWEVLLLAVLLSLTVAFGVWRDLYSGVPPEQGVLEQGIRAVSDIIFRLSAK